MKTIAIAILIISTLCGLNASPASPLQYIISPFGTRYVFFMNESTDGEVSSGACYHLKDDGNFVRIWEVQGFYARPEDILLSEDGIYLVRFRKLIQGQTEKATDFIEIYCNGALSVKKPIGKFIDPQKLEYDPFEFRYAVVLKSSAEFVDAKTLSATGIIKESDVHIDPLFLKFETRENVCYFIGVISGKIYSQIGKEALKETDAPMPWEKNK